MTTPISKRRIKSIVTKAMTQRIKGIDYTDNEYQQLLSKSYKELTLWLDNLLDLSNISETYKDRELKSQFIEWWEKIDDIKTAIGELQERKPITSQRVSERGD